MVTLTDIANDRDFFGSLPEKLTFGKIYAWGKARLTNVCGGMIDKDILLQAQAGTTLPWLSIQNMELESDPGYGDHAAEIDLPVVYFGGLLGCGPDGALCLNPDATYKCASDDVTVIHLPDFGHMDVMWGTHSLKQVKKPHHFAWMGLFILDVFGGCLPIETTKPFNR